MEAEQCAPVVVVAKAVLQCVLSPVFVLEAAAAVSAPVWQQSVLENIAMECSL